MTFATPPVALHLFNSLSNSIISEITKLPIVFSTSDCMNLDFYVTPLDSSYSLVFGYNWLVQHNPLIDWVNRSINFCPSLQENLTSSCIAANTPLISSSFLDIPLLSLNSTVSIPASETSVSNSKQPNMLLLALQHSYMYQNSWGPTISNSVFVLQTFRLTPQNVQKLLTFLMSLLSITNLLMFSAKLKLKLSLLTVLMTSKLIWKRVFNLLLALYTLFQHLNKRLWRNLLRKISTWVSSSQSYLYIVHQSYSLRRKMGHCAFVSTFTVLTISSRRIAIHSYSSSIY